MCAIMLHEYYIWSPDYGTRDCGKTVDGVDIKDAVSRWFNIMMHDDNDFCVGGLIQICITLPDGSEMSRFAKLKVEVI